MKNDRHLSPEERTFFGLLVETVYANPFGSDRERLGRLLGREACGGVVSQAGTTTLSSCRPSRPT